MKKLFFASLWALACLVVACSDEKDEPNDESGSIVGEWVFQRNEYYRNGKLVDSFTAVEEEDKAIAIFREDGTYRYYDFPPEEYYDGTYSYDEMSGVLTTDDGVNEQTCLTDKHFFVYGTVVADFGKVRRTEFPFSAKCLLIFQNFGNNDQIICRRGI